MAHTFFIHHDCSIKNLSVPRATSSRRVGKIIMKTLILGGVRSGKSRMAESLAAGFAGRVVYLATAEAKDAEMRKRIALHQKYRPKHWETIEEPIRLGRTLSENTSAKDLVVIDCLTLWMTNLLLADESFEMGKVELEALITEVKRQRSNLVLVSNETNSGVIPMNTLSRRFCDEMGVLHQKLAAIADNVVLMVAGIPTWVKNETNGTI